MANTVYRFRLEGVEYSLRGDKSEEELRRIVALVQEKLDAIHELGPSYTGQRAAMLAALQLADDLLECKRGYADLLEAADIGARYGVYDHKARQAKNQQKAQMRENHD